MSEGAPGVPPVDLHTTAGKLARMQHKRDTCGRVNSGLLDYAFESPMWRRDEEIASWICHC